MSTNHHDPYLDGTTRWIAEDMTVPLEQLDQAITDIQTAINTAVQAIAYIVASFIPGTPSDSSLISQHVFADVNATFASGLSGSKAICENAPTAEVILSIRKNGSEVGTITFASAATSGVLSSSGFSCTEGDKLSIVSPASVNVNIQDITISLRGSKDVLIPAA